MVDSVGELKTRAEILHRRLAEGDAGARARLRKLVELAKADDATLASAAATVKRKHCLAIVAREIGFSSWEHALRVLRGAADERDFGTLMYDDAARGTLNAWFSVHEEARAHLEARRAAGHDVFLLAYRMQFLVVEPSFIEALGLDPGDPDWSAIAFDWARPRDMIARERLYAKRISFLRRSA